MSFEALPNKQKRTNRCADTVWPDCGESFELNEFYRRYESCCGEIGETYIFFWSIKEIMEYEPVRAECYPAAWRVFASDGGGTYFGFSHDGDNPQFFSCDPIDPKNSVNWLGLWPEFLQHLREAKYI